MNVRVFAVVAVVLLVAYIEIGRRRRLRSRVSVPLTREQWRRWFKQNRKLQRTWGRYGYSIRLRRRDVP
jgi:hypothetical protein